VSAGGGALAAIVLSHAGAPSPRAAVASLLAQEPRPEIVVVHSGGPAPPLPAQVRVVHSDALLLPGGARNRGVDATDAPFVAFLAGDCVALPGWAAGRVREHEAGADAVADVLERPSAVAQRAAWVLLHRRRAARTPPEQRLALGLSYRRQALLAAGPFDEGLRQGEDTKLNERLLARGARVAYPTDVRIAHAYPRTVRAVLADARARGARRVAAERAIGGASRARVVREALGAIAAAPRLDRDPRVIALVAACVAAYAAGALRRSQSAAGPTPR
jgi:hypothetical protein